MAIAVNDRTTLDKIKQVMQFIDANVVQQHERVVLSQQPQSNIYVREEFEKKKKMLTMTEKICVREFDAIGELEEQHLGKAKTPRQPNVASAYDRIIALKQFLPKQSNEQTSKIEDYFRRIG